MFKYPETIERSGSGDDASVVNVVTVVMPVLRSVSSGGLMMTT